MFQFYTTCQISKIRLTVFPKSILATQRQRFELDTTIQKSTLSTYVLIFITPAGGLT